MFKTHAGKVVLAGLGLAVVGMGTPASATVRSVPVYVNGGRLSSDAMMIVEEGRTMLPMRALFSSLNTNVEWDQRERAVYAWTADREGVRFEIGSREAQILKMDKNPGPGNWGEVTGQRKLDVPAIVADNRVYIPIRAASESLRADVRWIASTPAVHINTGSVAGSREETPREPDPAPEVEPAPTRPVPTRPASTAAQLAQALHVRLVIGEQTFGRGETVPLQLVITNRSRRAAVVPFGSGQQFDFEAIQNGNVIWNWARDRAFTQVFSNMTLDPGEKMVYETSWSQRDNHGRRVKPGTYVIRGVITPAFPRFRPMDEQRIEIVP